VSAPLDSARAVRPGEELDVAKLEQFLGTLGIAGPVTVEQFPSGHSNLTYLVRAGASEGSRELVLRRPPFGTKVKSAHDMGREYNILQHITKYFPVPQPITKYDDPSLLGAPFYLMERLRGVIVRKVAPPPLADSPEVARGLSESFADTLARLHQLDWRAAGLGDLGKPEGYVERQVTGWTKRYHDARTDEIPEMEWLAGWLAERIPKESGAALIHNDYKYDNLVLAPDDLTLIIGVLDWEMSTIGDPLMDLGTALSYWIEANDPDELQAVAMVPTTLLGTLTRAELAERYARAVGRDVGDLLFYYVFAQFKNCGVVQQIYYRWKQGLTHDPRFEAMLLAVRILSSTAKRAAQLGRF
jgi:aminoglycoside phosphotransferase (APT) family kinase protein